MNIVSRLLLSLCVFAWCIVPVDAANATPVDLQIKIIDQVKGLIEIKNSGSNRSPQTNMAVICTLIKKGQSSENCAEQSPLYQKGAANSALKGWFMSLVPELGAGESIRVSLWDDLKLPKQDGAYAINLVVDPKRRLSDPNRENNLLKYRISFPVRKKVNLEIKIVYQNQPVVANVSILTSLRPRKMVAQVKNNLQRPTSEHPLNFSLFPGNYQLSIQTRITSNKIYVESSPIPFVVTSQPNQTSVIEIPSGELKLSSDFDGKFTKPVHVSVERLLDPIDQPSYFNFHYFTKQFDLPFKLELPAGEYKVVARHKDALEPTYEIFSVKSNQTTVKNINMNPANNGYLDLQVLDANHQPISKDIGQYLSYTIIKASTGKGAGLLSTTNKGIRLPSGTYLVNMQQYAFGGAKKEFRVDIQPNQVTPIKFQLKAHIKVTIKGLWSGQPLHISDCVRYYNPFNSKNLGALMGGGSASRGACFDPKTELLYQMESVNGEKYADGTLFNFRTEFFPGNYRLKAWPYGFPELVKSFDMNIVAGEKIPLKKITFEWPFKEEKVKYNGKTIIKLVRKTPKKDGKIKLTASLNGQPLNTPMLITIFRQDFYGKEHFSSKVFSSDSPESASQIANDGSILLPEGDYYVHAKLEIEHGFVEQQKFNLTLRENKRVNHQFDFLAGKIHLKVNHSQLKKNAPRLDLRIYQNSSNRSFMVSQFSSKKNEMDMLLSSKPYAIIVEASNGYGDLIDLKVDKPKEQRLQVKLLPPQIWKKKYQCVLRESHKNQNYRESLPACR